MCYASKTCQVTKTSNDGGHGQDGHRHSSLSLTLRQVSKHVVGSNGDGLAYAERDVVDRYVDRNCSSASAGMVKLTPVSERQAPCAQLLREDCVQEDVQLEDLLYTEILSDKVISKPWGRARGKPTFKTRVKRRTRRAQRDHSSQPESKNCSLMLFALSLHAGHDSAGIHSNVAAARALRGVDTEVVDLIQGASGHTTPRHAPRNVQGNAGNAKAASSATRQAPSGGTPQHQISQQRGKGSARERRAAARAAGSGSLADARGPAG